MAKKQLKGKIDFPQQEEEILKWWQKNHTFEKSVEQRSADKSYVFYDGPPFATGMPHYGHFLASTTKDVIPRYWTMKGYRVERVWGWDCHGLPIENMIEGQLGIEGGKVGIEKLGIDKFNQACRREVLRLDEEWEKIIGRLGRWVDFENSYKTMDTNFMESVWWGFKQLYEKDLVYEGRRVILYCPRCSTPLSNFEIAMDNSYKEVEDTSVFVKFRLKDRSGESVVAWTTTPWTLPGNVAAAVHPDADYVKVKVEDEYLWFAQSRLEAIFHDEQPEVVETIKGKKMEGWEYEPLYNYLPIENQQAYYLLAEDFVSLDEGTGVVHTAAIYGEDDYQVALERDLPTIPMIDDQGHFMDFVQIVAGKFYKGADSVIVDDLEARNLLFRKQKITHSYPFCYRCETPLFYNAVPAWFINIQKIKDELIKQNEKINWYPEHLKHGRFMKGLETAPDWNISRSRYWGTPMPIWRGEKDGESITRIIGSREELMEWAVDPKKAEKVTDLHREYLDDLKVWVDDDKTIEGTRIPEVFDCWVESGSMPFASIHYPFENKEKFEQNYPAQFVSEYIAQTRAWFYTMHVMSVAVFGTPSFENVLTTGTILAEDGSKMSKSKKNYPDPSLLIDKYGVDSLRLYLMSSTVMKGENLNFSEDEVKDINRRVFNIWWNVFQFYKLFADKSMDVTQKPDAPEHVMDKWLLSKVENLITSTTQHMDDYDVIRASRQLMDFVDELSTWYLRLSRQRLREDNNAEASHVFGYAIHTLSKLMAPLAPYFPETIHRAMVDEDSSIHLTDWPVADQNLLHQKLEDKMEVVQEVVKQARFLRSEKGINLRQPLAELKVVAPGEKPYENLIQVVADEVNVKQVDWEVGNELNLELDTNLTPELKAEGQARELMRDIQQLRKKAGLKLGDKGKVEAPSWPQDWQTEIEEKTNCQLVEGEELKLV